VSEEGLVGRQAEKEMVLRKMTMAKKSVDIFVSESFIMREKGERTEVMLF
jgi:hypothetical protein